jgi:hypothetical protein
LRNEILHGWLKEHQNMALLQSAPTHMDGETCTAEYRLSFKK